MGRCLKSLTGSIVSGNVYPMEGALRWIFSLIALSTAVRSLLSNFIVLSKLVLAREKKKMEKGKRPFHQYESQIAHFRFLIWAYNYNGSTIWWCHFSAPQIDDWTTKEQQQTYKSWPWFSLICLSCQHMCRGLLLLTVLLWRGWQ